MYLLRLKYKKTISLYKYFERDLFYFLQLSITIFVIMLIRIVKLYNI